MITEFITQPISSNGQEISLSTLLLQNINSRDPFYKNIWIVSAFARLNAVSLLAPSLRETILQGTNVKIVLGIDLEGTSFEALIEVLRLNTDSKIFKNRIPGHTFHPKIYVFESENTRAEIFLGSNNLTGGGIVSNYEASVRIIYDLQLERNLFDQAKISLSRYLDPPANIALSLNEGLIETLLRRGDIFSETDRRHNRETGEEGFHGGEQPQNPIDSPFGFERIQHAPRQPQTHTREHQGPVPPVGENLPLEDNRTLLWRKPNLPPSDVQRQTGNITGGLRLTQAHWTVNGQTIDQTTFFRNVLFGDMNWSSGENPPYRRETISVPFEININNHYYGIYNLRISHKPEGEAGQGNYTTMLHWGELGNTIRELNLINKTFYLFSPREGTQVPYRIVIE